MYVYRSVARWTNARALSVQSIHPSIQEASRTPLLSVRTCPPVSSSHPSLGLPLCLSCAVHAFSLFLFNRFQPPSPPPLPSLPSTRVAGPSQMCCTHHLTSQHPATSVETPAPNTQTDRQTSTSLLTKLSTTARPSIHPFIHSSIHPFIHSCRRGVLHKTWLAQSTNTQAGRQRQTYRRHPHAADPFVCLFRVSCVRVAPCRLSRETERQSGCVWVVCVGVHLCV